MLMKNPIDEFEKWFDDAKGAESDLPEACALATADANGIPSVRMVLLKQYDASGFVIYTNLVSQKAAELSENPVASLCFHWKTLTRQVRISGPVEPISNTEADAYFATRPRASQIGAYASRQSQVLPGRFSLEAAVAKYTAKFGLGEIPRPEWWTGFRLIPQRIEFWEQRPFRLHQRRLFVQEEGGWSMSLLYP